MRSKSFVDGQEKRQEYSLLTASWLDMAWRSNDGVLRCMTPGTYFYHQNTHNLIFSRSNFRVHKSIVVFDMKVFRTFKVGARQIINKEVPLFYVALANHFTRP